MTPMDDIPWSKRTLAVLIEEGMLDELTAAILALYIAAAVLEITVMWYYAVGAVVLGVFVAYAAMFGFDKFKELYDRLKNFKGI